MNIKYYLKIAPHIIGYSTILTAAAWLLTCFIYINMTGKTVLGVEPIFAVRLGELLLFGYATGYAVYVLFQYLKKLQLS